MANNGLRKHNSRIQKFISQHLSDYKYTNAFKVKEVTVNPQDHLAHLWLDKTSPSIPWPCEPSTAKLNKNNGMLQYQCTIFTDVGYNSSKQDLRGTSNKAARTNDKKYVSPLQLFPNFRRPTPIPSPPSAAFPPSLFKHRRETPPSNTSDSISLLAVSLFVHLFIFIAYFYGATTTAASNLAFCVSTSALPLRQIQFSRLRIIDRIVSDAITQQLDPQNEMFEGLVRQLILGYLGQYIKDIHREQLKITLWNEEVLLENVELILEAFDYLELPFALKQGRVGRLSIKIPWKKLGWDPIIIMLEDILVCASQREDEEWNTNDVERREFAGKKAKLAAAELAKLSQRVCDNQTGNSFTSYITAKIIDGIQVSIKNVHVVYGDMSNDKVRAGQVNKLVEIQGLEIYCRTIHGSAKDLYTGNGEDSMSVAAASFHSDEHIHLLAPVDVSASLSVLSLNEDQLQQILYLYDYLCVCRLREKYGRYRPWRSPISERPAGWQIRWWHYAQQSVLSDVRKRLKRTSWKYLGERLQLLDDAIVSELDQMEKVSDIDDILSYRSAAERELQEFLVDSASCVGDNEANTTNDKSLDDDQPSSKPQGWLKWLSRGMLGAGGTDDSSQFSGVVSDEVIKDIYEATKFHPAPSPVLDAAGSDGILLSSIKFSIDRISAALRNKKFARAIAEVVFEGNLVECMISEESAVVTASINTVEMINPLNEQVISEEQFLEAGKPSLNIHAYIPKENREGESTLRIHIVNSKENHVYVVVAMLLAHLSPSIIGSVLELVESVNMLHLPSHLGTTATTSSSDMDLNESKNFSTFSISVIANLESASVIIDLENGLEASCTLTVYLQDLDMRFIVTESTTGCWICARALKVTSRSLKSGDDLIICLSENKISTHSSQQHETGVRFCHEDGLNGLANGCIMLHYGGGLIHHRCSIWLTDVDLHCYPYITGLLVEFFDKLSKYSPSHAAKNQGFVGSNSMLSGSYFDFQRFGCSNIFETSTSDWESISVDHYPFITIYNDRPLLNLESSLIDISPDWKKALKIRETKINSSKFSEKKEFQNLYTQLNSIAGTHGVHVPSDLEQVGLVVINLHISSVRLHLHDSSYIVASVTLPAAKSSLAIHNDCLDVFCSTEGLNLSSSWCSQTLQDSLWGPASLNLSPVINIRVRKENLGSAGSLIGLNFRIQNVSCILPPEFLALLIGYFSLPDWNSHAKESPATNDCKDKDTGDSISFTYKFEILDSILFIPVVNADYQFLKLDIPQLYCTFIENCDSDTLLKGIPSECSVPAEFIADQNHCLNLFGRDLSLHHLLRKDDASDSLKFNPSSEVRSVSLIAPFGGDIWIRIPYSSKSPCATASSSIYIMLRILDCQLIVEGNDVIGSFGALQDVIEEFSSVENLSRCFTSDVLQFFQLKSSYKENGLLPIESSSVAFTEIKCSVQSMSVKLYSQQIELVGYELIAKAHMKFTCALSLKNGNPLRLDMSFISLTLSSLLSSVVLVECTSSSQNVSVLHVNAFLSDEGEYQLQFSLPCVNVWLFLSDWSKVIELLSFCIQHPKTAIWDEESKKSTLDPADRVDTLENSSPSFSVSSHLHYEDIMQHPFSLIVKSDDIGIKICIPVQKHLDILGHPKFTELNINGQKAKLKSNLWKTTGTVELRENKRVHSWPLFQLLQVDVEANVGNDEMEHMHLKAEVHCDNVDVWLSNHTFYFWQTMLFVFPEEAGSPQLPMCGVDFRFHLRKLSLLLTDQKWSSNGPLLEILMGSLLFHGIITENIMEGSVDSELQVNYNNIHKVKYLLKHPVILVLLVLWEPFLEPWKFQVSLRREHGKSALQNSPLMTDVHLESAKNLNINVTESFIEVAFRTFDMIKDAWDLMELNVFTENSRLTGIGTNENALASRYAPYTLENLTSLPLVFYISKGSKSADDFDVSSLKDGKYVQPGSSYPVYIDDAPDEQIYRFSTSHSSDSLGDRQFADAQHHYIVVQLEGTSMLSTPISIDLVGVSYFEVDFSNSSTNIVDSIGDVYKGVKEFEGSKRLYTNSGYVVPVVIDVSVQRYTKLVRLYSTVILLNATSVPFEVRFDIPFGVSPKILDPVYPGHEFPLPLHLAEAGRIRWRPLGSTYLWSEAYSISNILSNESKIGYLRSFVCYPSLPSSDPFRCCVSVHEMCLPSIGKINKGSSLYIHDALKQSVENSKVDKIENQDRSNMRCIHLVTLSNPLIVKNYLPIAISLVVESGGVTRSMMLSEVETSFYHIDSSHDLSLTFHMHGFGSSVLKFPRAEKFSEIAKFSGTKFSSSESISFSSDTFKGPLYVTMEKVMDAFSGAREICIFVPFLLYNCCGFPLIIANSTSELTKRGCTVPSCYNLDEQDPFLGEKNGLGLLSSGQVLHNDGMRRFPLNNNLVSTRKSLDIYHGKFLKEPFSSSGSSTTIHGGSDKTNIDGPKFSIYNQEKSSVSSSQTDVKQIEFDESNRKKVNFCMYSPDPNISSSEIMVRVSRCQSEINVESTSDYTWSNQFFLVPPTGSTTVLVPQSSSNASYVISVASSAVDGPFSGRTRIINFQPRYVISNACSKDLCYRQKGSDFIYHLKVGQNSHIHWTDITSHHLLSHACLLAYGRELLVSVRFNEPGWQWSGCFFPEHLGDTQLKMRNYVSGAVNMVRVEVQNADDAIRNEKLVGNPHCDSGTNLILLSDDDTGFMPYRIDNFSKELPSVPIVRGAGFDLQDYVITFVDMLQRIRIYQQKCEAFETVIHSYTSCPYAWDEPCYPHRLTVEVFAERVIGSYTLDDAKEYKLVCLPATSEKPERKLLLSVHAEGALKVLSIIDSSYHVFDDIKSPHSPRLYDQKQESSVLYKERLSIAIPFIGISVMSSQPQELLFACARNTMVDLVQSLDQQKFSLKIFALQIDNQLPSTPYPVILSFDHECKQIPTSHIRIKDDSLRVKGERKKQCVSDSSCEPVFSLGAAKWRNKDRVLLSFEYINLRMTDFHLELEQDVILGLFDFFKTVSSRFNSRAMPLTDSVQHPLSSNFSVNLTSKFSETHQTEKADGDLHSNSVPMFVDSQSCPLLPSIMPIGAPWQKIYLLARKQKKIYVELLEVAPVTLTLSFSSSPWMLRNGILTSGEYLIHRGLMALADVEGAQIHLRRLAISHQLASLESIREILIIHYTRQLLHEMYKSPAGLITGMAQGTTSLLSNTVYAISDAATQVSRAAHKGIVAFTMDDPTASEMERQQKGMSSHGKGVINEILEGLTGLLQSPIRGAEKHGLPGVLSVTEKTARSIRNRSRLYHMGSQRLRVRLPRPLSRDHPLRPYLWEEAVGVSVLADADTDADIGDNLMLKDETLVLSKALKQGGKFVIITERLILIVSCSSLVNLGKPEFRGVPADLDWVIEAEITLDSVIHVDNDEEVVHIVGSSSDVVLRQNQNQHQQKRGVRTLGKQRWHNTPTQLPLFQTNLECSSKEEAVELLKVLLATIQKGKERGWGCVYRLHQRNIK
ncbi:hypothetical protein Ccrd_007067 [Cynara cardunculus var. scolymus]|uniref:Vacuolar protein sorting-associated protein n=1 Tax=Cynara cardunculus var. scolymus TaxID=59895 RepID=A0A103XHJ7_CYNCS|nr:hypothetical protein Ccrd_007067 [Cynara cardunculus var. scolymus]